MKNWIARLFGVAPRRAGSPAAPAGVLPAQTAAQAASSPATPDPAAEFLPDLDSRFYCWLAGSTSIDAPPATEALILAELARLAHAPVRAAGLVPRVPAVIPELLRSLRDDSVSGADIARLVAQDVVLVGEVIREANSSWYRPPTPVRTIDGALILLGQNGLRMLLARVAFRPVLSMQPGRFARQVAPHIWRQSEKCALAASTLAPTTGADPFEAFLAGLVQNVGLIVAFRLIDQVCSDDVLPASPAFVAALFGQARRMAHGIALHWEFPHAVAGAILEGNRPGGILLATPLAQVLSTGDRLAKLRLLVDAGAMAPDDPAVAAIVGTRLRPCYDRLADQPAAEDA